jgi:hypothetical protein
MPLLAQPSLGMSLTSRESLKRPFSKLLTASQGPLSQDLLEGKRRRRTDLTSSLPTSRSGERLPTCGSGRSSLANTPGCKRMPCADLEPEVARELKRRRVATATDLAGTPLPREVQLKAKGVTKPTLTKYLQAIQYFEEWCQRQSHRFRTPAQVDRAMTL